MTRLPDFQVSMGPWIHKNTSHVCVIKLENTNKHVPQNLMLPYFLPPSIDTRAFHNQKWTIPRWSWCLQLFIHLYASTVLRVNRGSPDAFLALFAGLPFGGSEVLVFDSFSGFGTSSFTAFSHGTQPVSNKSSLISKH